MVGGAEERGAVLKMHYPFLHIGDEVCVYADVTLFKHRLVGLLIVPILYPCQSDKSWHCFVSLSLRLCDVRVSIICTTASMRLGCPVSYRSSEYSPISLWE